MGAGDAPRPDAERRKPVRRLARGADRRGSRRRSKPGRSVCLGDGVGSDRGTQRAPPRRCPFGGALTHSRRRPADSPSDPS